MNDKLRDKNQDFNESGTVSIPLSPEVASMLSRTPETGMGFHSVLVTFDDGCELTAVAVNCGHLLVPPAFAGARIATVRGLPDKEHKLFNNASRVTTEQLEKAFKELKAILGDEFSKFELSKSLPTKKDHGDIDVLVLTRPNSNIKKILYDNLGSRLREYSKNSYIYSILYNSYTLNINVHVDFIVCFQEDCFISRQQYYSYNDFSGILGMFSKHLNFKYGSEGFFKRYKDEKGNWHDILISHNLMDGLEILGYDNAQERFNSIGTMHDIINFILSSRLVDYRYYRNENMNQSDRKSVKRPVIGYCVKYIVSSKQMALIRDPDYFFKIKYYTKYKDFLKQCKNIEKNSYIKSKYGGEWLKKNFQLNQGKNIGIILKAITDEFGDKIHSTDESDIKKFVKKIMLKLGN